MLERREWVLFFLGQPSGPFPADQIRVMKGLFLLSQRLPDEAGRTFSFQPYSYGPFDKGVYDELDELEAEGLVRAVRSTGSTRRSYDLTQAGVEIFNALLNSVTRQEARVAAETKEQVTSQTFTALLKSVYSEFPEFSVNSIASL